MAEANVRRAAAPAKGLVVAAAEVNVRRVVARAEGLAAASAGRRASG
jgi:hypothetical protein